MDKITGKYNQLVKDTKKLLTSSKERKEKQLFVLEGARLCFDVLNSFYKLDTVLLTEDCMAKYSAQCLLLEKRANRMVLITEEIVEKLGDTATSQGIFCVCNIPPQNPTVDDEGRYVALDSVQDPGNLGAIIRSGEALGISGVIAYDCCDVYNPKALRASMGSILRMPVTISKCLKDDLLLYKADGFDVYATVPDTTATDITTINFSKSSICVIGNEANGITQSVKDVCDKLITIPMKGRAESLNASVAASITMWEMMR